MSGLTLSINGNFDKTEKWLKSKNTNAMQSILEKYAEQGVTALQNATPKRSGATAFAWGYKITKSNNRIKIEWTNSNKVNNVPIAILIQYGHGTGTGGYVQGIDYINPAMKPIFDNIVNEVTKEIQRL